MGTKDEDHGLGIATDWAGQVYTTGYTDGWNAGGRDAFVAKGDATGNL